MPDIIKTVTDAVLPVLQSLGAELVDVEFSKKFGQDNLTVFIHTQGGVTLDFCEKVHLAIDPVLDEVNPTGDKPYVLNVSSPGLDRPFRTQRDFERNYGTKVEVKLYAPLRGKKLIEGILTDHDDNTTTVLVAAKNKPIKPDGGFEASTAEKPAESVQQGNLLKIENNRIALVRPLIEF